MEHFSNQIKKLNFYVHQVFLALSKVLHHAYLIRISEFFDRTSKIFFYKVIIGIGLMYLVFLNKIDYIYNQNIDTFGICTFGKEGSGSMTKVSSEFLFYYSTIIWSVVSVLCVHTVRVKNPTWNISLFLDFRIYQFWGILIRRRVA